MAANIITQQLDHFNNIINTSTISHPFFSTTFIHPPITSATLPGSERAKRTGATGGRLKESVGTIPIYKYIACSCVVLFHSNNPFISSIC